MVAEELASNDRVSLDHGISTNPTVRARGDRAHMDRDDLAAEDKGIAESVLPLLPSGQNLADVWRKHECSG